MTMRETTVGGAPARTAARHLRRRARLGGLRPDRVRRRGVDRCSRTPWRRPAGCPAATRRSTPCGPRRAIATGGADVTPDETPYEAGLGFCVRHGQGRTSGATPSTAASRPDAALACLTLADPLRGRAGQRAGPRRGPAPSAGSPAAPSATRSAASIAFAYLPTEATVPGTARPGAGLRGLGRRRRWRPSRCTTPRERGFEHDNFDDLDSSDERTRRNP